MKLEECVILVNNYQTIILLNFTLKSQNPTAARRQTEATTPPMIKPIVRLGKLAEDGRRAGTIWSDEEIKCWKSVDEIDWLGASVVVSVGDLDGMVDVDDSNVVVEWIFEVDEDRLNEGRGHVVT